MGIHVPARGPRPRAFSTTVLPSRRSGLKMSQHRFTLRREWARLDLHRSEYATVNFVMMNPSTADDTHDDPTIRKCVGFAKRWGCAGLTVTNLWAYRATDPKELKRVARSDHSLAVGHGENVYALKTEADAADIVVVAWGTHGAFQGRADAVLGSVLADMDLYCIGKTKDGHPLHPCMAGYTDAPVMFRAKCQQSVSTCHDTTSYVLTRS